MNPVKSTAEILALRALNKDADKIWAGWAKMGGCVEAGKGVSDELWHVGDELSGEMGYR